MKVYILLIIGIWIGIVLGLSFIEAPLKFQAPGITTKLGLGIGRLVFGWSNKIQLIFSCLLLFTLIFYSNSLSSISILFITLLLLILGVQTFYLLPLLDTRALQLINNHTVPHSYHHLYFVGFEIVKIGALLILFINLYSKWTI